MQVTLMGPDDLGNWFLTDDDGNSYPFVACHDDHLDAELLGWSRPVGLEDEEAIEIALDWLLKHTGEDFAASYLVAEYFEQLCDKQQ